MKADDVYRFVTLRQPASLPPSDLRDPSIGAYSYQSVPSAATYRQTVSAALAAGDTATARSASAERLQQLGVTSAWTLLSDKIYRPLFLKLPSLVKSGVVPDIETAILTAFDSDSVEHLAARLPEIARQRETVADYFAACSLTSAARGDLDGAAHLIFCFETLERLLALPEGSQTESPRRNAWRVPLQQGVVMLPFDLGALDLTAVPFQSSVTAIGPMPAPGPGSSSAPLSFIGDLIILKQQLRHYELGEIAYIENVLAKEHLDRTYRTLGRTESKLLTVEDTEKEVTHDLQMTTRDELSSEIQKTISEQVDLSVNFNVSATYMGPAVSVTASLGGSAGYKHASEERTSTAMAHSQEVVSRASEKIRERTLTQREKVEIQETEQTSAHGFNNETSEHVVGLYRWLERAFDMHLVNYGRRLIYEFVVPEPASFWADLVEARGNTKSGPPPEFPQLVANPGSAETRGLTLDDFNLVDPTAGAQERPSRWTELVELAGSWGVPLESPPPVTAQVHFALNAPGEASPSSTTKINTFSNSELKASDGPFYYKSGTVNTVTSTAPLKIPTGYRATEGYAAMKGWMYSRVWGDYNHFENGEGYLELNGKEYGFEQTYLTGGDGAVNIAFSTVAIIPAGTFIEGEVPVILTTSLNGLSCSIRLECQRTDACANAWSVKMFSLFAAAHAERLARYEEDKARAAIGNVDWAGNLPSQTARDIERRELKRGILTAISNKSLPHWGDTVLVKSMDAQEPVPKVADLQLGAMASYEQVVRFFELAFDWNNLAYIFAPYFFGRRSQWTELAVADNADAQFKAFLSAGAARVQVPVRQGYETHVTYFFENLGLVPFEQRIPWLASMRPIAEDLAADAREGFDVGDGKISIATNSTTVTGVNTLFRDPEDVDREIRISGKIYVIRDVKSATEATVAPAYRGLDLKDVAYELGGIVVGPPFPLKLATTLVAIDKEGLVLPEFAGRYAE